MNNQINPKLGSNLFPHAHIAIEDWESFPWHKGNQNNTDTHKHHSSQALAIDVFGTLKIHPDRSTILNSFAEILSIPTSETWEVFLEWMPSSNPLKEINKHTQVDAVTESDKAIIFFECKFTELEGGVCSQTKPLLKGAHKGKVQCNQNYQLQINPVNRVENRCALSGKGIRYWEFIPEVFDFNSNIDYSPCPFAGSTYQWMRNITNSFAVGRETSKKAAFCLIYADREDLSVARMVHSQTWQTFLNSIRSDRIRVEAISYQDLIQRAIDVSQDQVWQQLRDWVIDKIAAAPLSMLKSE